MRSVREIYQLLDEKAPFALQEPWDNSGMLVGRWDAAVNRVLLTLDITPDTIAEAAEKGCELILSHHPVIFQPLKAADDSGYDAKRVLLLAERRIAAICSHTCLDTSPDGVNDVLAERCGLTETVPLEATGQTFRGRPCGIGRVGTLEREVSLAEYLERLRTALRPNGLRYYDAGRPVKRVAVGGGACGSMLELALRAGCDTFVTGDLKYDHFLAAKDAGLNLVDAGHYPTEVPVMERVGEWLRAAFPELTVYQSARHREFIDFA